MAVKIRRRSKGYTGSIISDQFLTAESREKLNVVALHAVNYRIGQNLADSYHKAMQSIAGAFSGSLSGTIRSGGSKRIGYAHLSGASGKMATTTWGRLSERYLDPDMDPTYWTKKVPGTPFWRNQGDLAAGIHKAIVFDQYTARTMVKDRYVNLVKTHHKGRFRYTTLWEFQPLRDRVADELIRAAFVNGQENVPIPSRVPFDGYQGVGWKMWINEFGRESRIPYAGRPFIVRLAAQLGREMHTRARKVA